MALWERRGSGAEALPGGPAALQEVLGDAETVAGLTLIVGIAVIGLIGLLGGFGGPALGLHPV